MIHALYYVSQHTAPLLKVLPFTCYLISVIRGQWIQPKVLPWLISKQKPCIPWKSLFQMENEQGLASHTGQESRIFSVTFLGCDNQVCSFVTDFQRYLCWWCWKWPVCVVSKLPGALAKEHILTRVLWAQKGCPPAGGSCGREKAECAWALKGFQGLLWVP